MSGFFCAVVPTLEAPLSMGIYAQDATIQRQVGLLAATDPDGPSPIFGPPLTNQQGALIAGAGTFQLGPNFQPFYHFVGGTFPASDVTALPSGLRYSTLSRWNDFLIAQTMAGTNPDARPTTILIFNLAGDFGR